MLVDGVRSEWTQFKPSFGNLNMFDLVRKYVFISNEESYVHGQIVGQVNDDVYVVRKFANDSSGREIRVLYSLSDMLSGEEFDYWAFFDERSELDEYTKWLEAPEPDPKPTSKVVKLVKE